MLNLRTLSIYLFKLYCSYFILIFSLAALLLVMSSAFDVLQKFKSINIPTEIFWQLSIYKVPYLINEIAPLISFIALLFFARRLNKYNEIVVMLSSGIQFWRILIVPVIAALLLGLMLLLVINPIGTLGLQKHEKVTSKILKKKHKDVLVSKSGIFFFEEWSGNNRVFQVQSINTANNTLSDIIILFVDSNNKFVERIDAKSGSLDKGEFLLREVTIIRPEKIEKRQGYYMKTNLSISGILRQFIEPEFVHIWSLPSLITSFSNAGLPVVSYQIYLYKQLFKPLIMVATLILAACFVTINLERTKTGKKMLVLGMCGGFLAYCVIEISVRFLSYNGFAPVFAVLLPTFIIILVSNFVILHLHEA